MSTNNEHIVCPGCGGIRVQKGNDGITITCPVCSGRGWIFSEPGVHITC